MIKMKKMCIALAMLGMSSLAFGAQVEFTGAGADNLWSNSDNWGSWPIALTDTPRFDTADTVCIIDQDTGEYASFILSKNGPQGSVLQYDHEVTTASNGFINIGRGTGADGLYHIYNGLMRAKLLDIPKNNGIGTLLVMGGLVDVQNLNLLDPADGTSLIDVRGGVIQVLDASGDITDGLKDHRDAGRIIGYGGAPGASVDVIYNADINLCTITANSGLSEYPANGTNGVDIITSNFTWTTPLSHAGLTKNVYFGEKADLAYPDLTDPNGASPDFWAARFTTRDWVANPNLPVAELGDTDDSIPVSLVAFKDYYCQIDYVDPGDPNAVISYLFSFDTQPVPPTVNAGYNQMSFLDGGSRIFDLAGSVSAGVPTWTVESALTPNDSPGGAVAIDPNTYSFVGGDFNQVDSQFEVTVSGKYTLILDALSSGLTSEFPDSVVLFVRDTACEITVISPNYITLAGDTNDDCMVDLIDVSNVAATWMQNIAITETLIVIPEEE